MKRIKKYLSLILMSICLLLPTNVLKAYSASINVSADRTYLVVGNTINVSVTLSSSDSLGVWDYNISYDTSKLKLISGDERIIDTGDPSKYSVTNTFEFKVIASGTSTISVKNLSVLEYYSKESMDVSESSVVITGITQEELEASYSKNNDLASLTVDGYSLSPEFNKDTLDYTVVVPSNTEKVTIGGSTDDYKSTANGFGEFDVSEGENKFTVTVTAENGSTKTYTVKVKVEDTNPIEVLVDGIKHTVVKRESSLKAPSNYEKTTVKINGIEVPGFKNTITNFTLVGLKNQEGELNLYIYDEKENTFTLYNEIKQVA